MLASHLRSVSCPSQKKYFAERQEHACAVMAVYRRAVTRLDHEPEEAFQSRMSSSMPGNHNVSGWHQMHPWIEEQIRSGPAIAGTSGSRAFRRSGRANRISAAAASRFLDAPRF